MPVSVAGQSLRTTPSSQRQLPGGSSIGLVGSTPIIPERVRLSYSDMQQSDEDSGWNGENGTPSEGESLTSRRGFTSETRYRRRPQVNNSEVTMKALKEITGLVNGVAESVDAIKDQLAKEKHKEKEKSKPPLEVRSEVRKAYNLLLEEVDDFNGFDLQPGVPFSDDGNQRVAKELLKEVKMNNKMFSSSHIRAAIYTYYRTKCQEHSLKQRDVYGRRTKLRRRQERISRKLRQRKAMLEKLQMVEKDKEKWRKVMRPDMMTSEESMSENEELMIVPLTWRSKMVTTFFRKLDEKSMEKKSSQAKRQRKLREGAAYYSQRPVPDGLPRWTIATDEIST